MFWECFEKPIDYYRERTPYLLLLTRVAEGGPKAQRFTNTKKGGGGGAPGG